MLLSLSVLDIGEKTTEHANDTSPCLPRWVNANQKQTDKEPDDTDANPSGESAQRIDFRLANTCVLAKSGIP